MAGRPVGAENKDKPFRDALRMEAVAAERGDPCEALPGSLRWNARALLERGDTASIREIADRLDGKPTQESKGDVSVAHRYVARVPEKRELSKAWLNQSGPKI